MELGVRDDKCFVIASMSRSENYHGCDGGNESFCSRVAHLSHQRIEEREGERTQHRERGRRPVEIKFRRKDKAGGDQRSPRSSASSASPPPDWNFNFRVIKAVGQYSVLMGLSVGNLIVRWDEMGLPLYPILGMFGADRFDAILLPRLDE
ncbi:uncharacterized protein LOC142616061 [Castanea sativa]|uniref:uncharacterized protein LOC142616061 n=1 Tax=Castanea sativa TaxID=21020 RepID=UPI003F64DA7E